MNKAEVFGWIKRTRIVPVVRAPSSKEAIRLAEGLIEGGIDVLEITLTVPGAIETIRTLAQRADVLVGAGTVLDPESAKACLDAGARFVVSPALNVETVKACNAAEVLCAPACSVKIMDP